MTRVTWSDIGLRQFGSPRSFWAILRARVTGEIAFELGTEHVDVILAGEKVRGENRVTNVYRRENGAWKIVHHHTDLDPAMLGVLNRLQAV